MQSAAGMHVGGNLGGGSVAANPRRRVRTHGLEGGMVLGQVVLGSSARWMAWALSVAMLVQLKN